MIGVSLPFQWLLDGKGALGDREAFLSALKDKGVDSIELRTVHTHQSSEEVLACARYLWGKGFRITVHGAVASAESAVEDVFGPLLLTLRHMQQDLLNVTIHPINGDNVKMLTELSDYCLANELPVCISLENNRLLPDKTEGDCAALVLDAVKTVNRSNVGICFDMGHYLYYVKKNFPKEQLFFPPNEFFRYVRHTHIHGLNGYATHFPLGEHELPIKEFFKALAHDYFGEYNLELDVERVETIQDPAAAFLASVDVLKKNLPFCTQLYDDIRKNFDERFENAVKVMHTSGSGTRFSLVRSSSYLFNTDGYSWGMDLTFGNCRVLAKTPNRISDLLKDLKLMIITHEHEDHFEESTVKALAENDTLWVVPEFLKEMALKFGIREQNLRLARCGELLQIGPLNILPFKGMHRRPVTLRGVDEYGYYITAPNAPSMIFPADVRDYSDEGRPDVPVADYCFANVWMGDHVGLAENFEPNNRIFAEYMVQLSQKNIFLTHLYEVTRFDEDMWRMPHAEVVKNAVKRISPQTAVLTPAAGKIYDLSSC